VQEEELDSCRAAGERGPDQAGCGCREKPKRVLPARFWQRERTRGGRFAAPLRDGLGGFLGLWGWLCLLLRLGLRRELLFDLGDDGLCIHLVQGRRISKDIRSVLAG
jgi:hypothetical protein